jgi:hypothetical protein
VTTQTQCELCKEVRAVMLLYAMNPGKPQPTATERGVSPFYPPEESDVALNLCTDCFHDMAATMREEKYVAIRATAPRLNKPAGSIS